VFPEPFMLRQTQHERFLPAISEPSPFTLSPSATLRTGSALAKSKGERPFTASHFLFDRHAAHLAAHEAFR
jgi:hypothetical protein